MLLFILSASLLILENAFLTISCIFSLKITISIIRITNIRIISIIPTPFSSYQKAFNHLTKTTSPFYIFWKAAYIIIANTSAIIMTIGIKSFVPACSPSILAFSRLSFNTSAASYSSILQSPSEPFFKFWTSSVLNFMYFKSPVLLPKSS